MNSSSFDSPRILDTVPSTGSQEIDNPQALSRDRRQASAMPSARVPTTPPYYDYNDGPPRRRSTQGLTSEPSKDGSSKQNPLSSPISPTIPRNRNANAANSLNVRFAQRLRCNSGLSLHVNEDALRQYTDYNADGTSRGPLFKPFNWQREGENPGRRNSAQRNLVSGDEQEWTLPIPDVLGLEIFRTVLKDPAAAAGLLKFSRGAGYGVNMAYLAKVGCHDGDDRSVFV